MATSYLQQYVPTRAGWHLRYAFSYKTSNNVTLFSQLPNWEVQTLLLTSSFPLQPRPIHEQVPCTPLHFHLKPR